MTRKTDADLLADVRHYEILSTLTMVVLLLGDLALNKATMDGATKRLGEIRQKLETAQSILNERLLATAGQGSNAGG